jgi:TIR domain
MRATRVFISYRRDDTRHFAGRVADTLGRTPGVDEVFLDTDGITPGAEFPERIKEGLREATHVLVLIGLRWDGGMQPSQTQPRLFDEADFVRQEVAAALESQANVIPVLVDGAAMPTAAQLPFSLQGLRERQAYAVYPERRLQDELRPLLAHLTGRPGGGTVREGAARKLVIFLVGGLAGLLAGWLLYACAYMVLVKGLGLSAEQMAMTDVRATAIYRLALLRWSLMLGCALALPSWLLRRRRAPE